MAPPMDEGGGSLMSMKEIDAALLQMMDDKDGPGSCTDPERRAMLQLLDKKSKLELLVMTDAFEERLKKASPKQVREMVDSGLFKIVCTQLGGFRGREAGDTAIAMGADRLSVFLDALPEMSSKAWEFGAVRPITAVVMKKRDLNNPELLHDEALRAALSFLVSMGKPWYDHLINPGSQEEAKKASGKLYRWMLKEGIVDAVVKICATVLWFATLVQLDKPQLASSAELLKPIFHYLLEEPNLFSGVRAMALSLLLHLWLFDEADKRPEATDVRKAIAQHKDAWKLVNLLKDAVDNPSKGLPGVEPHTIIQASFACLLQLLINTPPARPLPTPFLETACPLLGKIPDALVWVEARSLVVDLYHSGAVSETFLLTHAFPGLLNAFVAEVARRGGATSPPPDQRLLLQMTTFLLHAFGRILENVARQQGRPRDPDLLTAGTSLNLQTLPRLAELVVSTRAAAALASLLTSPFYQRVNMACAAVAEALHGDAAQFERLLNQMVPPIVLAIHDGGDRDWARRVELAQLLRLITRRLRPGCPELNFAAMPPKIDRDFAQKRCVKYHYGSNMVGISLDVVAGKQDLIARLFKALDADTPESQAARGAALEEAFWAANLKGSKCSMCRIEVEVLKQCARCHGAEYCSAACQKKDWPEHKKACKEKDGKKRKSK